MEAVRDASQLEAPEIPANSEDPATERPSLLVKVLSHSQK
jgi:hypothetical protein